MESGCGSGACTEFLAEMQKNDLTQLRARVTWSTWATTLIRMLFLNARAGPVARLWHSPLVQMAQVPCPWPRDWSRQFD